MTLSKENREKLNTNYLYKKEPIIDNSFYIGQTSATYHCKNWTFKVYKYDNGKVYMRDTYFNDSSHSYEVTDKNINDFEFIFDFREVKRINDYEYDEYNEDDIYRVATSSGGYSCGKLYWVNKDAVKSNRLLIKKKEQEIRSLKNKLEWAENDLVRLKGE